ncbi:MAG: hypothetical protein V8R02_10710 [Clostridium sp.]|jgi:hypothetical protein
MSKSLNNIFIKIGISVLLIVLIVITLFSNFAWQKTEDLLYVVIGVLCILGILFNIYLLLKEKSK